MAESKADRGEEQHDVAGLLNENQRRVLGNVLRRLERASWRLEEQLMRQTFPSLALTHFTDSPDSAQRAALLHLARNVRQEIARLAALYQLEVADEHVLRSTMAEFTLFWCDLEDSRPQKLSRYGALHPQAEAVLGPQIARLIELTLAIDSVARGKAEVIQAWQDAGK
jgi:hypothetical protein